MSNKTPDPLDAYIDSAAALLGLPLEPAWKGPIRANLDVTLKLEEQNRNQLTFGAGVSQFEGFFGQLSFQTSNFLGRGESLTLSLQAGSRAENYQVAFTEPFLFDRNITGGIDVFKRSLQYVNQFTQKSTGGNILFGFPVADLLWAPGRGRP